AKATPTARASAPARPRAADAATASPADRRRRFEGQAPAFTQKRTPTAERKSEALAQRMRGRPGRENPVAGKRVATADAAVGVSAPRERIRRADVAAP